MGQIAESKLCKSSSPSSVLQPCRSPAEPAAAMCTPNRDSVNGDSPLPTSPLLQQAGCAAVTEATVSTPSSMDSLSEDNFKEIALLCGQLQSSEQPEMSVVLQLGFAI